MFPDSEKRIKAFKAKCMRKLLCISYLDHKTNDWVQSKINFLVGPQEPLRLIRDGEIGGREFLYLTPTRYTVTTRMILH